MALGVVGCNNPAQAGSVLAFWELIQKMDSRHISIVLLTLMAIQCSHLSCLVPQVEADPACLS